MSLSFDVNSPAFKGASVTQLSAPSPTEAAPQAGGALLSTPAQANPAEQKVRVTGRFAQFGHGAGCNHCTSGIASKVFEGRPNEVKSMMAAAATQAQAGNKAALRAQVVSHENAHFAKASSNGLLKVGAPVINDDAIEKAAMGQPVSGPLGYVSIGMPDKTPATAQEAKDLKAAFQTAKDAALAPGDPSDQDQAIASKAGAKASEMDSQIAKLESEGKDGAKDAAEGQSAQSSAAAEGAKKKPAASATA